MPAATVDHSQKICEVWASNLDEELKRIRQVIRKYNYIAMVSLFKCSFVYFRSLSDLFVIFILFTGHRVSRCSRSTNWRVQK